MSAEANKALISRYQEIYNSDKLDELSDIISPNLNSHTMLPGLPGGVEGAKMSHNFVKGAFPDNHITTDDLVADDDKVVQRFTARGTHLGDFIGIPATGKKFEITGISIFRIADGKIVEHWANMDSMGLMQQLGVMPTPGQ